MRFARFSFLIAGILGTISLVPLYFLEEQTGIDSPPAITHPEFYYGFIGIALVFQLVFFMIATDPLRYRPIMIAAILEKLAFALPVVVLYVTGRLSGKFVAAGALDLVYAFFFVISYIKTTKADNAANYR